MSYPEAGTVADLTTNTVNGVAGRTTAFARSYSGCAWAPWWGAYGSLIIGGGGHGDGEQNDLYRIDVETQLVTQIKPAAPSFLKPSGLWANYNAYASNSTINDPAANGWMWANATVGDMTVQVGEPFAMHWYCTPICLPADAIAGHSAENGWLYTPGRNSCPRGGSASTKQDHALALGVATTYIAPGENGTQPSPSGFPSVYDPVRNRVWWWATSGAHNTIRYRDLTAGTSHSVKYTGGKNGDSVAYYEAAEWDTASGCIVTFGCNTKGIHLAVFDPTTLIRHNPTITNPGSAPAYPAQAGYGYSEVWRAGFYYVGTGLTNTIHFLKCNGPDPRTSTWTWSSQTVTGAALRKSDGSTQAYNRLRHCAGLGDMLLWHASDAFPTQIVHLASAP